MTREEYLNIAGYMEQCMDDAAHDKEHVWRVLGYALLLAEKEENVNYDLLIAACLLHDVGRSAQFRDPALKHAEVGAEMAEKWLHDQGYPPDFCSVVRSAIRAHSFRTGGSAENIEAQILYDSDKLDACGMMGLFRTISYCDHVGEPYYTISAEHALSPCEHYIGGPKGEVEFTAEAPASVVQEYCYKLSRIKESFYTKTAKELAGGLSESLRSAMESTVGEVDRARSGLSRLDDLLYT